MASKTTGKPVKMAPQPVSPQVADVELDSEFLQKLAQKYVAQSQKIKQMKKANKAILSILIASGFEIADVK